MSQQNKQNQNVALSYIEHENRIVLVLLLVSFLGIFMDYQARKHYESLPQKTSSSSIQQSSLEEDIKQGQEKLDSTLEQYKVEAVEKTKEGGSVLEKANAIVGTWNGLKEKISSIAKKQRAAEIYEAHAVKGKAEAILAKGESVKNAMNHSFRFIDEFQHTPKYYFLYYIRFYQGKKSKLIRVKRLHHGGVLRLSTVLKVLQRGPNVHEKGLLNNFDHRIKIFGLKRISNAVVIDVNSAIIRMGPHVITDRIEQLTQTLTQFPNIDYVHITIGGKKMQAFEKSDMFFPEKFRPQRKSFPFTKKI